MHVGLVGSGPAAAAARDAVAPVADSVTALDPDAVGNVDLALVVGRVGADGFDAANATARATGTPWLAVELGGVGGHPLPDIEAAVSGFAPGQGCFDCLRSRVAANAEGSARPGADDADARFAGALAGREAVRLASGEPSPALGGVIEVPHAQRRFLPVPDCDCADGRDRSLDRSHEPRDLDAALGAAERALDPRVGIVREVGEVESFPAPYYLAELADTTGFSDVQASRKAAGVAAGWDTAFMKALGEGLERYAAGVYREREFERSAPADTPNGVAPAEFVASPAFPDPDPDAAIPWVVGERLDTGAPAKLPAEFVAFPPPDQRHRPAITTGLGLGNGGVEALLSGLYEVVERDAAMLAWYSTFEPLGLDVDDDRYREIAKRARSEGLEATALLLTQDADVPVVAACLHRDSGAWPRFAAGMAADLDPEAAAAGALEEALQNWLELRGMGKADASSESGAIGSYAEFPPAAREFVAPDATVPAASVGPDGSFDGESELSALVERVVEAGMEPYAARLTPRDLDALGFEAVRVLVPSAQPLFTDEPYFGERAERVPRELGFEPRPDRDHHPFP
ncbi:YcaO-like family protein [Halosegnis marinus]|uniref:YcaO-like family protein n=1 Tax=Halosegnis marinus TaxID=3034023 RepID=A0ABD5ZT87_9EURY|nr:YcaO-like family protein [Halosegnis sp. DT85]